jgi:hypothetical protein
MYWGLFGVSVLSVCLFTVRRVGVPAPTPVSVTPEVRHRRRCCFERSDKVDSDLHLLFVASCVTYLWVWANEIARICYDFSKCGPWRHHSFLISRDSPAVLFLMTCRFVIGRQNTDGSVGVLPDGCCHLDFGLWRSSCVCLNCLINII